MKINNTLSIIFKIILIIVIAIAVFIGIFIMSIKQTINPSNYKILNRDSTLAEVTKFSEEFCVKENKEIKYKNFEITPAVIQNINKKINKDTTTDFEIVEARLVQSTNITSIIEDRPAYGIAIKDTITAWCGYGRDLVTQIKIKSTNRVITVPTIGLKNGDDYYTVSQPIYQVNGKNIEINKNISFDFLSEDYQDSIIGRLRNNAEFSRSNINEFGYPSFEHFKDVK
jgi:hypothetical protein